ncbi:reverse transcriptase zinc-binding domain-containing protein [Artemisia annua]|uniref:Reverse transcriptase zinc-binding domain-containing protein n=1 Tax=Artemisia annua TaxID=35608 RepID=A0A2U1NFT1_ARTAN|nr:reverse transcriptase zinc-binding domain-containing protein [Artemisia annua]
MAKFKKRLANWKSIFTSIGGRLTLVNSVLKSLGIYYLSLFPIPVQVNKKIESMRARFFWGIDDNVKKIQWVKWDFPKRKEGLMLIKSCHGIKGRFLDGGTIPPRSGVWASIVKASMELHTRDLVSNSAFRIKVGNSRNTRFWLP